MLTIFDGDVGYPISNDDYYIRELASGYDEIVFNVSIRDSVYQYVKEEAVIRDRDEMYYLIKQIDAGETSAKVVAQINLDDWKNAIYLDYSNESDTIANTVLGIAPSGWSVVDRSSVTKKRTIPTDSTSTYNVTALEILEDCTSVYGVRFRFDTSNKIIYIINPDNYESAGAFASRDLNLKKLNYKGKSSSFVTRLYAEGADGMTFASINDGKAYVDDQGYAEKVICAYWKDERYTDQESLLEDAQAKLDEMAYPEQSYDCDVFDLANTNPDMYGFQDFSLFSVITLVDDAKGTRTDYQVVERWTYPYYPAKNKVVLSSSTPNIQSAIAQVVSSISSVNSSSSVFQQIIASAIANSTALITGNSGGYVVFYDGDGDGYPDEILIMDTADIETATKVWRWNSAGLGYSNTGYGGTYALGITMDGAIVADFITAGELDGAIIKAGTIEAEALSVSAKEELSVLHNYLVYSDTLFTDISAWSWRTAADGTVALATVDGEACLALDGSELSAFSSAYYAQTNISVKSQPTLTLTFKQRFSDDITISSQRNWFIYYYSPDNEDYNTNYESFAGDYSADEWYEYTFSWTLLNTSDYTTTYPKIGFYHVPGVIRYIKDVTLTASVDGYVTSYIDFTAEGLQAQISEVANQEHNYLPYDAFENIARWTPASYWGTTVSYEDITVDGKTKTALKIDGSNASSYNYAIVFSDITGDPDDVEVSFKYQYDASFTASVSELLHFTFYPKSSSSSVGITVAEHPTTITADTEYSISTTLQIGYDVDPYQSTESHKPQFEFIAEPGQILYIYDLEITGTEDIYKTAVLSYTSDGLSSIVQNGSIISSINQSAESVTISANKLNLTGDLTLQGQFTAYDPSDNTNYIDMTEGEITVVNQSDVIFTIDTNPLIGSKAGIFFGDPEDSSELKSHTHIDNEQVTAPNILAYSTGDYDDFSSSSTANVSFISEAEARFYGGITVTSDSTQTGGVTIVNGFLNDTKFSGNVYNSSGGTVFVSDKRKKKNIKDLTLDKARSFLMSLKPKQFQFIEGTSGRKHHGFIAQDVKEVMTEDWGLYVENKEIDFIGLRYEELIADMIAVIQDQQQRIEMLERRLDDLTDNQS